MVDVPSRLRALTDRQRHSLIQIVREALSNVARHAQATQVEIKVREVGNHLLLTVRDDGRGFEPSKFREPTSFGLHNMHQRAIQLSGTLTIESEEGHGTTLTVQIPFRP